MPTNRKISDAVVDKTAQKTGIVRKDRTVNRRKGNPTTKKGGIFGSRFSRGTPSRRATS